MDQDNPLEPTWVDAIGVLAIIVFVVATVVAVRARDIPAGETIRWVIGMAIIPFSGLVFLLLRHLQHRALTRNRPEPDEN